MRTSIFSSCFLLIGAKRFRADWLDDSSGYTVLESVPGAEERVRVRYDAASGKRTVLDSPQREKSGRPGNISPDGQSVLYSEQGNLYVRDLSTCAI
jgi:dipeptidyl-peptidase-4